MTLDEILLQKLSDWHPDAGRHTFSESAAGWAVNVVVDRQDTVGCLVVDLSLTRTAIEPPTDLTLRAWAERIAGRASGLLESLKVLEIDDTHSVAVLRSDKPARKGETIAYYEVRLTGTTAASVRRYQIIAKANQPREQVAFAVTHEALAKLVGDIAG